MDKNKCTHLILGNPGGKKHIHAIKWGVSIANPAWITDSLSRGFAQHIKQPQYEVATPDNVNNTTNSMNTKSRVEETVSESIMQGADNYEADVERILAEINDIDIEDDLLDGNRFFISGFTRRHTSMIEKTIKDAGGFVFQKLSASVGQIICSRSNIDTNPDIIFYRKMTGPRPFVVDLDWVHDAIVNAETPENDNFLVFDSEGKEIQRKTRKQSTNRTNHIGNGSTFGSTFGQTFGQMAQNSENPIQTHTLEFENTTTVDDGSGLFEQTALRNKTQIEKKSSGLFDGLTFVMMTSQMPNNLVSVIKKEKGIILGENQFYNAHYLLSDKLHGLK